MIRKQSSRSKNRTGVNENLPGSWADRSMVSAYRNAYPDSKIGDMTLIEAIQWMKAHPPPKAQFKTIERLKRLCHEIDDQKSKEYRSAKKRLDALKTRLFCFTPSGDCPNGREDNKVNYNANAVFDLDGLWDVDECERVFRLLTKWKHCGYVQRSVSGTGIKVVVPTGASRDQHKATWDIIKSEIEQKTGHRCDPTTYNLSRLWFASQDEGFFNPNAEPYPAITATETPAPELPPANIRGEDRDCKFAEECGIIFLSDWQPDGTKKNVSIADVQCPAKNHDKVNHCRLYRNADGSLVLKCFGADCQPTIMAFNALLREKQRADLKDTAAWLDVLGASVVGGEELRSLELPKRPLLLGDWFAEGDCGFVYAPRGVGKTWCALGMGAALSYGGKFGEWKALAAVKVLYVDGEMPADDMQARSVGLAGDNKNLLFLQHEILFSRSQNPDKSCMNLTLADFRQALTDFCVREGVKVLFLDNLSSLALGMRENEADDWETVLPWLLDLRRRKIAVVIVHHAGRSGKMRGTTKREDALAWIIALEDRRTIAADKRGARFISYFDKPSRNTQEETPPYEWHLVTEADGRVTVGCERIEHDAGSPKNMGRRKEIPDEKVLGLLEPEPLTAGEWQRSAEKQLKMRDTTFWHRLKEYRESARIEKTDDDKWRRSDEKPF